MRKKKIHKICVIGIVVFLFISSSHCFAYEETVMSDFLAIDMETMTPKEIEEIHDRSIKVLGDISDAFDRGEIDEKAYKKFLFEFYQLSEKTYDTARDKSDALPKRKKRNSHYDLIEKIKYFIDCLKEDRKYHSDKIFIASVRDMVTDIDRELIKKLEGLLKELKTKEKSYQHYQQKFDIMKSDHGKEMKELVLSNPESIYRVE